MQSTSSPLRGSLAFTRAGDVSPDPERPGLLRARTIPFDADPDAVFDVRPCVLNDCAGGPPAELRLEGAGFETVDLSSNEPLQAALATVRRQGGVADATATALRAALQDSCLRLDGGRSLRIDHVADDGLILRLGGPNGLDVNPGGKYGTNGRSPARNVHADQDVFGTPLRQLMKGAAPDMFRHRTPDGRNDASAMFLLNLWIPIDQITRPLVLMDRRTLDAGRHQLRYGLPVDGFLERDEDSSVNDIWTFLPDDGQKWYFRSSMGPDQGYVFDTLGTPHGATVLPGEDALEALYRDLARACDAAEAGDADALRTIAGARPPALPDVTTEPIRAAWRRMTELLGEAARPASHAGSPTDSWPARARAAMDAVVRKSIEMRLVATLVGP